MAVERRHLIPAPDLSICPAFATFLPLTVTRAAPIQLRASVRDPTPNLDRTRSSVLFWLSLGACTLYDPSNDRMRA